MRNFKRRDIMVCLIMAYLVPIIMTVILFSVRLFRKDKVTANFISPFLF